MAGVIRCAQPPGDALPIRPEIETAASTQHCLRGPSILQALRGATRSAHARIEASQPMLRLMNDDYTEPEYVEHLCRLLGFYEPFEVALAQADAAGEMPFFLSRSRRLRCDLENLGMTQRQIQALPRCSELPLVTRANLLGCRYVYEGAALGGQIIARHLQQSLASSHSFAFYHGDAARTGRQWKAFCLHLETREAVSLEAICESAVAVFDTFGNWFEGRPLRGARGSNPQ